MTAPRRVSLAGFSVISADVEADRVETGAGVTMIKVRMQFGSDVTGHQDGPLRVGAMSHRTGPTLSTDELRQMAKDAIMSVLSHEVDEWLRVDEGRKVQHGPPLQHGLPPSTISSDGRGVAQRVLESIEQRFAREGRASGSADLHSCPFCGSADVKHVNQSVGHLLTAERKFVGGANGERPAGEDFEPVTISGWPYWFIACTRCGARGPIVPECIVIDDDRIRWPSPVATEVAAAALWNMRRGFNL